MLRIKAALLVIFCVVLSVVLVPSALAAQGGPDADLKEIQAYRLTVPALKQVMTATRNIVVAMKSDPRYQRMSKLEAEAKRLEDKDDLTEAETDRLQKITEEIDDIESGFNVVGGNQSLSDIEAAAAKEPLVGNAFKAAGISARDYAKFMAAFLQASMIQGLQQSGTIKEIPKEVNRENIKFIEDHQAEFAAFMKELDALDKKEP